MAKNKFVVAEGSTSNKSRRGGEKTLSLILYVDHIHLGVALTLIIPVLDQESLTNSRSQPQ